MYLKENPPRDKNLPGPNQYQINSSFVDKSSAAYSLRPNTSYMSMFIDPTKNNPGPGSYNGNLATDTKNGTIFYSKYKSPGSAVISKNGRRFDNTNEKNSMKIPGPGSY